MRTYLIISISNCDGCMSSSTVARVQPSRGWQYGPRCGCGAQIGPMDWMVLGRVRAKGQFQALAKYHEFRKEKCRVCIHRREIPGDAHSRCAHPAVEGSEVAKDPLGGVLSILASVGRIKPLMDTDAARELLISGDPYGIKSGWFNWPWNFDPTWLRTCIGFEGIAE